MIAPPDLEYCVEAIRHGSRSFHAASKLLPARVRNPALALYAFCRLADDAVDLQPAKAEAVLRLHERLDKAYSGCPENRPADRAFAAIIAEFDMPRALPDALLEGLAWDAMERRYATLSDLRAYSARVASAVGVMMCVLMRVRDRDALARACDLGLAMQLTNIARDVGEDAREGRLYLPIEWMDEAGIDVEEFLAAPRMTEALGEIVQRLLSEAQKFYQRSETGISALPFDSRPGIFAARYIYAGIGHEVRRNGYDAISQRARTGKGTKLMGLALAVLRASGTLIVPRSSIIHARPEPEVVFLVEAAAELQQTANWSDTLHTALVAMKKKEAQQRTAMMSRARGLQ